MRFLAILATAAILSPSVIAQQAAVRTLTSAEYAAGPSSTLIDVREPAEWIATGVPAGAKTISLSNPDFVAAVEVELGSDKTRPVAVICRAGNRSVRAADALAAAGFTNVTNIADGMLGRDDVGPGWLGSNLATQAYPIQ